MSESNDLLQRIKDGLPLFVEKSAQYLESMPEDDPLLTPALESHNTSMAHTVAHWWTEEQISEAFEGKALTKTQLLGGENDCHPAMIVFSAAACLLNTKSEQGCADMDSHERAKVLRVLVKESHNFVNSLKSC